MKAPAVPLAARRQPVAPEFFADDWLFVKQVGLKAGELAEQHVHDYDHVSAIAVGTVRLWIDGADQGEISAPKLVTVAAGAQHKFLAVSDALFYCIHNLRGESYPATRK